jgi:hypothetical protein
MAIVVEDGTGVAGANSYVTEAEYVAWLGERGLNDNVHTISEHIYKAMDYLEAQNFIGVKANKNQALQWPRHSVWVDNYPVDATEIPKQLKLAQFELMLAEHNGDSLLSPVERQTVQETVGAISVTYASNQPNRRTLPAVTLALKKLIQSPNMVSRA